MLQSYRTLWSTPKIIPAFGAVFVSALPIGMASLAIILSVQQWTGSLPLAGVLAGVFNAGNAAGLLIQGRMLSRHDPARVVIVSGLVSAVGFAILIMIGYLSPAPAAMIIVVAIGGVSVPAITTAVRAWLPLVVPEDADRTAGYALLAVLFQGAILIGPLLVSLAVLINLPAASLGLIAVLLLAAILLFRRSVRSHRTTTPATTPADSDWWRRGLGWLLLINISTGLAMGVSTVAVPGVMTAAGVAALTGAVASAGALGDVLGALGYGARAWTGNPWTRLALVAGIAAVMATVGYLVSGIPWLLVVTGFAGGLLGAPLGVLMSGLLDRVVPPSAIARGYSTLVCAGLFAAAVGNGLAAGLVPLLGVRGLLALPPFALLASAGVALAARRSQ